MVHEAFHQYQRESFTLTDSHSEERYPVLDIDNTALAVLEMRLLMDGLRAVSADDRGQVQELTAAFVAVRTKRWDRADPFVQACAELGETTMEEYLLRDFEARLQGPTLSPETVARHRIYPVGSTLGVLLDYFHVDLRPRAARDGERFSFVGLLDEQLAWAKERYDFERLAISGNGYEVRYGEPGTLTVDGRHVTVNLVSRSR